MRPNERKRGKPAKAAKAPRENLAQSRSGKLAPGFSFKVGFLATLATAALALLVAQGLGAFQDEAKRNTALLYGGIGAVVVGGFVAIVCGALAGRVAARVTDIGLAVARLGRTTADVRVRISGNDEVTALGRAVQYLASDLAEIARQGEKGQATLAANDPAVRAMRDRVVPQGFAQLEGFELDGAISVGTRGGLDYFDLVAGDGGGVVFLLSAEGASASAAIAVREAREALLRELRAGANARDALTRANRALKEQLARGVCAKASVIEFDASEARVYQAGYRAPVLWCSRGNVEKVAAEGLALGLDDGPVFDQALRPSKIALAQGTRLVLTNEAGLRVEGLLDLVAAHSPKHTTPFMNLILSQIEMDAGKEGLREDLVLLTLKRW